MNPPIDDLTEFVENTLGFKLGVSPTNNPIPIQCITLFNGIPKEEGGPIQAEAYSQQNARVLLAHNIKKYLCKDHCSWRLKPHYAGDNIRCRVYVW